MIEEKLKLLNQEKHWTEPVILTEELFIELGEPSVRSLADTLNKSKSWVDKSLQLAKGLKLWPELKEYKSRDSAYKFIIKRNKQRRSIHR